MATMRDVAARAGVSAKTVSRVFNNDPHVLPQTRERVKSVMNELNYIPNMMATEFRAGRSPAVGVAVPDVVDPFFAMVVRSVDEVARQRGVSTVVSSLGDDPATERPTLESLLSRKLMGMVLVPVGIDHSWLKRWQDHTPLVFVDREPTNIEADFFVDDGEGGGFDATSHLLDQDHRRVAYVGGDAHLSTEIKRLAGYRRALEVHGVDFDEQLVISDVSGREDADRAVSRLARMASPATAVFSANARCTMALAAVLRHAPFPMVGFGDFPLADVLTPSITVVDQNPSRLGQMAAERVFARIDHPDGQFSLANILSVSLVRRDSA